MDPLTISLIVGGIVALISGAAGAIGSADNDKKARDKIDDEKKYLNKLYTQEQATADEQFKTAKEEAEKNAARAKQQADLTDLGQDIAENSLSNDFNSAIDQLYLSQANDTMSWYNASMQAASSTGANYASLAASGVRAGGSLSNAVLMESATNASQLQFSQDAKRRSDNNNLASVLNNLAGGKYSIYGNRVGADVTRGQANDLINSYRAGSNDFESGLFNYDGGSQWNLYQAGKLKTLTQKDYQIDQLSKARKEHEGWNSFFNGVGAFFGTGAKGFETGYDVSNKITSGMPQFKTNIG